MKHKDTQDTGSLAALIVICTVILTLVVGITSSQTMDRLNDIEAKLMAESPWEAVMEPKLNEASFNQLSLMISSIDIPVTIEEPSYLRDDVGLSYDEQHLLYAACEEFDIPYELALAIIWRETGFRNISVDGEYFGYMMLAKKWVWPEMEELGVTNLMDPADNFRIGCCIMRQHIDNKGSVEAALCRYSNDYSGSYASDVLEYMASLT